MVGWERERVADQQVGTGPQPLESVPGEHAPFRGAHELYVERLSRLGKGGQPHGHGRALLDLPVATHHRLGDAAHDPLGAGRTANGIEHRRRRGSVMSGGDHKGQRGIRPVQAGPGHPSGLRPRLRRIGVGRERRADPHRIDPTPAMSISSWPCATPAVTRLTHQTGQTAARELEAVHGRVRSQSEPGYDQARPETRSGCRVAPTRGSVSPLTESPVTVGRFAVNGTRMPRGPRSRGNFGSRTDDLGSGRTASPRGLGPGG